MDGSHRRVALSQVGFEYMVDMPAYMLLATRYTYEQKDVFRTWLLTK